MRDQTAKCEATPKKHMLHAIKPYNDSTNAQCMIIYKGTTTGRPRTMTLCRHGAKDCGLTPAKRRAANSSAGLRGRSRGCAPAHLSVLVPMTSEGRRVSPPSGMAVGSIPDGGRDELEDAPPDLLPSCKFDEPPCIHASMHVWFRLQQRQALEVRGRLAPLCSHQLTLFGDEDRLQYGQVLQRLLWSTAECLHSGLLAVFWES